MPDRQGAVEAEAEDSWMRTAGTAAGDAVAQPQPQATVARMQRAALDPRLRAQFVRVDYPVGWDAAPPKETDKFHKEGHLVPGDSGAPQDAKPPWFDEHLFREGQRVSQEYLAGLAQSDLLSLLFLFAVPEGLDPLVATAKSDTPETAGRRYLSTNMRLLSWYSSDPFDPRSESYRNLVAVRRMHAGIRKACMEASPEELSVKFDIGKGQPRALNCPAARLLEKTLSSIPSGAYAGPCPARTSLAPGYPAGAIHVHADRYRRPFLSQGEMAVTQWGFFGLFICKPEAFAAPAITRPELEALIHMWAVLGYCLGIEDRFNWALGGLDVVLKRSEEFLRYFAVPSLRALGEQGPDRWEHMGRCMMEGMRAYVPLVSFEANLAYLTEDVLGLGTVLPKALTWVQTLQLWRLRLVLQYMPRWFASWTSFMSSRLRAMLRRKAAAAGLRVQDDGKDDDDEVKEDSAETAAHVDA